MTWNITMHNIGYFVWLVGLVYIWRLATKHSDKNKSPEQEPESDNKEA